MLQALQRRFRRAVEQDGVLPDVLLIDGGAGQVAQARAVLADLGVDGPVLVGVAKGEARRPGDEPMLLPGIDGQPGRELQPGAAIGSASGGERVCRYVYDSGEAGSLK